MTPALPPTSEAAATLRPLVVDQVEALEPHLAEWDALAVAAGLPFCAPAWMLAWWREGRSGDARLRVVLVLDADGALVGVGPFFAQVGPLRLAEYRLLGAGFCHRIGPLARAGREREVAAAIAGALAAATPTPASVVFEGIDDAGPWPELFAAGWPGRRPRLRSDVTMDAPAIELDGEYEAWMARRERKFRKEARRTARRLEEDGVHGRIATEPDAVEALLRLHYARWEDRGGSNVGDEARRVIADAARGLGDDDRLAVALLEGSDGPIAAELVLRAGDSVVFWGGGFDPAWSKHAPGTQAMLVALEAAGAQGVRAADLGGGAHDYKWRLSDGNRPLAWRTLFPRGRLYPLIRLRLAPKHARFALRERVRRLPEERQQQLRRVLRRAS